MKPPFKLCPKCGIIMGRVDFSRDKSRRDGLQRVCKRCNAGYHAANRASRLEYRRNYYAARRDEICARSREHRAEHGDAVRAKGRAYAAKHRDAIRSRQRAYNAAHKEEIQAWDRAYKAANKDKWRVWYEEYRTRRAEHIREYMAAWRAENQDRRRDYQRAWTEENREIAYSYNRNRRARKLEAGGTHTAADVVAQHDRQKHRCYWCGASTKDAYHVDHVTPLARGGSNGPENLVIACPSCNLHKHAKHPMDFAGVMF